MALAGGCRRGSGPPPAGVPAGPDPLALLPVGAQVVASIDLARARQAPVAALFTALRPRLAAPLAALEALTAKTGFDPWRSVDNVVVAEADGLPVRIGVVMRGALLDEARAEAYARERLTAQGDALVSAKRGSLTLWSPESDPSVAAFYADPHTFVLATGGWGEKMIDLARGAPADESAASRAGLVKLCERVRTHPVWLAFAANDEARQILAGQPTLRAISGVTLAVDLDKGLAADLTADLPSPEAADAAAEELANQLVAARHRADLEPLLKHVTTFVSESALKVGFALDERTATTAGDVLADLYGAASPRLRAIAGDRPRAIKFTAAGTERWSAQVAVGAVHTFSRMGNSFAMMEVANRTAKPVVPEVAVLYLDPEGHTLKRESCLLPTVVVLPNERMPCLAPAPLEAASASYSVGLLPEGKAAELAGVVRPDLKVVDARLESPPGPDQLVIGDVVNGTRARQRVRVQASFYDSARVLVGTAVAEVEQPVGPGEKAPFKVHATMLPSQARSFTATAFAVPGRPR